MDDTSTCIQRVSDSEPIKASAGNFLDHITTTSLQFRLLVEDKIEIHSDWTLTTFDS